MAAVDQVPGGRAIELHAIRSGRTGLHPNRCRASAGRRECLPPSRAWSARDRCLQCEGPACRPSGAHRASSTERYVLRRRADSRSGRGQNEDEEKNQVNAFDSFSFSAGYEDAFDAASNAVPIAIGSQRNYHESGFARGIQQPLITRNKVSLESGDRCSRDRPPPVGEHRRLVVDNAPTSPRQLGATPPLVGSRASPHESPRTSVKPVDIRAGLVFLLLALGQTRCALRPASPTMPQRRTSRLVFVQKG